MAGPDLNPTFPAFPPNFFLTFDHPLLELTLNEIGMFTVRNGIGQEIACDPFMLAMAPSDLPANAHAVSRFRVTQDPLTVVVFPKRAGRTSVQGGHLSSFHGLAFGDTFMTVVIRSEVKVFFQFLDGPAGIKTTRSPGDLDAILATMNAIYRDQTALVFRKSGVNPRLLVPGLGTQMPGVRVNLSGSSSDTTAIKANFKAEILFNVFFVGDLIDMNLTDQQELLAITSKPPNDDKPLRCCLCRDPKSSDPPGIDPGKTLAHEAGHALGEDDDNTNTNSLMFFSQSRATGTTIDRAMAARMLASFNAFPP